MLRDSRLVAGALAAIVLLVAGGAAARSSAPLAASAGGTKTFTLPAGSGAWVSTGIDIPAGGSVRVTVSGDAKCGAGTDCPAGNPLGAGHTCATRTLGPLAPGVAPDVNYGAVGGRVGPRGAPFMIGAAKTVDGPGVLYLVYEDCAGYYGDNSGSFTVKVTGGYVLSGKVVASACSGAAATCKRPTPVEGVTVTATGSGRETTTTGKDGTYSLTLPRGTYTVTPRLADQDFTPPARTVELTRDVPNVNFSTCSTRTQATRRLQSADSRAIAPIYNGATPNDVCPYMDITLQLSSDGTMHILLWKLAVNCGSWNRVTLRGGAGDSAKPRPDRTFYVSFSNPNVTGHLSGRIAADYRTVTLDSARVDIGSCLPSQLKAPIVLKT